MSGERYLQSLVDQCQNSLRTSENGHVDPLHVQENKKKSSSSYFHLIFFFNFQNLYVNDRRKCFYLRQKKNSQICVYENRVSAEMMAKMYFMPGFRARSRFSISIIQTFQKNHVYLGRPRDKGDRPTI